MVVVSRSTPLDGALNKGGSLFLYTYKKNHFTLQHSFSFVNKDQKMSIDDYIESLTNIHKHSETNKIKLSTTQTPTKNQSNLPGSDKLTCYSEFGNSLHNMPHQLDLKSSAESKIKTAHDQGSSWRNTSIEPRIIKATNLESNRVTALKEDFKNFQQQYMKVATEYFSSETVSSETDSSYFTAIEDFTDLKKADDNLENVTNLKKADDNLEDFTDLKKANDNLEDFTEIKKANDNLGSDISFDSGIDEGKRDLITRLLQSKGEDCEEEFLTDFPTNSYDTHDLVHDIEIEQRYWNEDVSENLMYEERMSRFFQTTNSCDPARIEISANVSSRQYFMNLLDEDFSKLEIRKRSNSMSPENSL